MALAFSYWGPVYGLSVSFWFLLLMIAGMTTGILLKRQQWQFSVFNLLAATTLVAVVLGLVVWLSR
jgi:hypothetical protein